MSEVLIWDRRVSFFATSLLPITPLFTVFQKGSLPISRIKAHKSKIYGIDWSHERRNEIVTCSLDKTIKVWDVQGSLTEEGEHAPKRVIETGYPIWRARDLRACIMCLNLIAEADSSAAFGQGVLSLPQRGVTALEMFSHSGSEGPVEVFEGHTDVVKEFVWRKGGRGNCGMCIFLILMLTYFMYRRRRVPAHYLVQGPYTPVLAC